MVNQTTNHSQMASFIWSVADLLRGNFRQSQYGRIILPFTLLRRLECVLAPTKEAVLAAAEEHQNKPDLLRDTLLKQASGEAFFNTSSFALGSVSDRKSTRLNSSHVSISYAVFCLKKKTYYINLHYINLLFMI